MFAVELERAAALAHLEPGGPPAVQREERGRLVDVTALAADHPAEHRVLWIPRDVQHRLLPRVLGPPDVAASADGPPQGGKIQLEHDDLPHGEDDIARSRHFAANMPDSSEPVRAAPCFR